MIIHPFLGKARGGKPRSVRRSGEASSKTSISQYISDCKRAYMLMTRGGWKDEEASWRIFGDLHEGHESNCARRATSPLKRGKIISRYGLDRG